MNLEKVGPIYGKTGPIRSTVGSILRIAELNLFRNEFRVNINLKKNQTKLVPCL